VRAVAAGDISNTVWHIWQGDGGGWSDWWAMPFAPPVVPYTISDLALGLQKNRRLKISAGGITAVQVHPNNEWGPWHNSEVGTGDGRYAVVANELNGNMNVFSVEESLPTFEQNLWRTWETSSFLDNNHGWSENGEYIGGDDSGALP
jgi:hypothetical protein